MFLLVPTASDDHFEVHRVSRKGGIAFTGVSLKREELGWQFIFDTYFYTASVASKQLKNKIGESLSHCLAMLKDYSVSAPPTEVRGLRASPLVS